jgi:serine/threonine protein kinase
MQPTPIDDLERTAITIGDWLPGYEILAEVGAGGFGTVFKARQLKLDRIVAVKVMRPDWANNANLVARFEAEAIALGRLQHPNLVQVHDCGRHGERVFVVMELLEGEDLGQRIRRLGQLSEPIAWAIARQAAAGLAHAAGQGVVHRDIKPANLFLVPPPTGLELPPGVPMVKVTDFGLALMKWTVDATSAQPATVPGTVLGTPAYMAPEQYNGASRLDHRADIYALGATVFHALTGALPFDGSSIWNVAAQKAAAAPRLGPQFSAGSADLLAAMMHPDPAGRVGTYEELIERIDNLPKLPQASSPTAATSIARFARRHGRGAAIVGLLLLAGAAGSQIILPRWSAHTTPSRPTAHYRSSGYPEALFNGRSMAGWLPPSAGGAWQVEADDEGAPVLTGSGFVRHTFAAAPDYRVTIGLDVHTASAAEVHLAIPAQSSDRAARLVLRVSRTGGAIFGTKSGDRGDFRPLGEPVPFPPPAWFEGRRPYLEVRFERAGGVWIAWFNGAPAGHADDDGTTKTAELRLFADAGRIRVDSVVLEKLQKSE